MRMMMRGLLESLGLEVVAEAGNGIEAVNLYKRVRPQLVTMDITMPEMDGVELFQKIVAIQPDVHGIFLTAFTTLDTVYPAIMSGIERVLAKPVVRDELVPLVESLISDAQSQV